MSIAAKVSANIPPATSLLIKTVGELFNEVTSVGVNSLTSFTKTGRIASRVYIDSSVSTDPVITDILKTVQTQYCGFILTALQMNQLVSSTQTVQDLLRVVATEDYKPHENVVSSFGVDSDRLVVDTISGPFKTSEQLKKEKAEKAAKEKAEAEAAKAKSTKEKNINTTGKIVSVDGDSHIPSGKIIEVTLVNPQNPEHKITINLLVQLAPYLVPEALAVQFITKDQTPSFYQRLIQWKTGEISFFKDFLFGSDIIKNRAKLLKLDPSGVFADMMSDQQSGRSKVFQNILKEGNSRARNISNSVLIFNQDTVTRAKADSGIDIKDFASRENYFAKTFAMILVVVDILYNQVTFYYNGIEDAGTFSFDQMRSGTKGNSMDLISVMNALNQGKSPKF